MGDAMEVPDVNTNIIKIKKIMNVQALDNKKGHYF